MRRGGFTLVEALLALTILALASVIVYGALSASLASWSAGVRRGREGQVARIALDRISQQLKSAVPAAAEREGSRAVAFEAGEGTLRFVTARTVSGRPLAQVSYSVEEDGEGPALVYREHPWPDRKFFEGGSDPWVEERVPEITGASFTAWAREEGGGDAREEPAEWDGGSERELPAGVSLSLTAGEGEDAGRYGRTVPVLSRTLASTGVPR